MSKIKKGVSFLIAGCLLASTSGLIGCGGNNTIMKVDLSNLSDYDYTVAQLMGTDSLGRKVEPVQGFEKEKYVGMFYFMCNGTHGNKIYDISKLLEKYGDVKERGAQSLYDYIQTHPLFVTDTSSPYYKPDESPVNAQHYWGEPLYGYYQSEDPWVLRKHLEEFAMAGIDYLLLDFSNKYIYETATYNLLDIIVEMQAEGYNPPKVVPMLNSGTVATLEKCYEAFYSNPKYDGCWFRGDETINPYGGPLIIGDFRGVSDSDYNKAEMDACLEKYSDFWLKQVQWPNATNIMDDAFPWMDFNIKQHNYQGIMSVSAAQHLSDSSAGYLYENTENGIYRARGWTEENATNGENPLVPTNGTEPEKVLAGANFERQWDNAISQAEDLYMVVVTAWNEWGASKIPVESLYGPGSRYYEGGKEHASFIDVFNYEYSRDTEMMKGGYGDNYYLQTVRKLREFKGITDSNSDNLHTNSQVTDFDFSSETAWQSISRKFLDFSGDAVSRNYKSFDPSIIYTDNSNRTDIDYLQIANDSEYLYVKVTAKDIIDTTDCTGEWMRLYLSDGNEGGWDNFTFSVIPKNAGEAELVRFTGVDKENESLGSVSFAVVGNSAFYKIPLSMLNKKSGEVIQVKAVDSKTEYLTAEDFYCYGDAAPIGRLNYGYKLA